VEIEKKKTGRRKDRDFQRPGGGPVEGARESCGDEVRGRRGKPLQKGSYPAELGVHEEKSPSGKKNRIVGGKRSRHRKGLGRPFERGIGKQKVGRSEGLKKLRRTQVV